MRGSDGELFDLVGEIRNLNTAMLQIVKVLKDIRELLKKDVPEEGNGGKK